MAISQLKIKTDLSATRLMSEEIADILRENIISGNINPGVDALKGNPFIPGGKIEIAPSAQHFQGGVKIGEEGQTTLKGLYVAGECAGGQHGANRPGGNALGDPCCFRRICAEC